MGSVKTEALAYAFFQGKIVKTEDAKVSIMTNALQYGTGIFGGLRGYYNKKENYISVFRIDDHYKRFLSSIHILGCAFPYSASELRGITLELLKKNSPKTDVYFRPFAYLGHTNIGPNLADATMDFSLYMIPMGEYLPVDKGLSVLVSSWRRITENSISPRAKISGAYVNSALARKEAIENGYDEAIFLNDNGHVCEGSAENIFIVRDGVLITPSIADDILEGITRRSIIQLAKDLNISVEERSVARSELYIADEAFFAGTGVQVAWIREVDKRRVGDGKRGKITSVLQDKFFKIARGEDEKYKDWCTKVEIKSPA
ncbi:branched-chain amino acid transaminase [Patescibacteria group bacterium]|nr:branched-chain amino acid transaminase [Patescibacteria group bacterium]